MHLSDRLRADVEEIVETWTVAARRELSTSTRLPDLEQRSAMPELVRELAACLDDGGARGERFREQVRSHAMLRLEEGFGIAEVVHEYSLLRRVIQTRLLEAHEELEDLDELSRLDEAIDQTIAEAAHRLSKEREARLWWQVERTRLALEAAKMGMWEWSPRSGELMWDARCRELGGVGPEDPVDYDVFASAIHPDDRARVETVLWENGCADDELELEYRVRGAATGPERWVEVRGRVLDRDAQGHATCVIGTVLDVTERKRRERELATSAEFRERFLGIVSHDLRNPLSAIRMGAGLLLRAEGLPAALRRPAERIAANADRIAAMITDLLDLTRGRLGGGIPVEQGPCDLHGVVQGILQSVRLEHPERQLVSEERGDANGEWDPERVAQAIGNLLANALEHGDPSRPVRIEVDGADPDQVAIAVHNDGDPIPAEEQAHLFDPFRGCSPRRKSKGLGLGLFIASEVARAHGGSISVRSTAAEGTTFRLILPRRPRPATRG